MATNLGVMGVPITDLGPDIGTDDSILVSGVWKSVERYYVCISETWKEVTERNVLISSAWET
jgi:hypothetical protein